MGLRPRFTTPLSQARETLGRYLVRPFEVFRPQTRLFVGFGLLVVVTTLLLLNSYSSGLAENYREGDVVTRTVVAPVDITTVDIAETEKRRNAVREATRSRAFALSGKTSRNKLRPRLKHRPGVVKEE